VSSMAAVRQRQTGSKGPSKPNQTRPPFVRRRVGNARQSFVANAGQMTASEAADLSKQVQRERAEKHVMEDIGEDSGDHRNMPGMSHPNHPEPSDDRGSRGGNQPEAVILRRMLEDIRGQCKGLERKLAQQRCALLYCVPGQYTFEPSSLHREVDALEKEDRMKKLSNIQEAERRVFESTQEASNAWGLLAKDRDRYFM
jgi:hypothetical protein